MDEEQEGRPWKRSRTEVFFSDMDSGTESDSGWEAKETERKDRWLQQLKARSEKVDVSALLDMLRRNDSKILEALSTHEVDFDGSRTPGDDFDGSRTPVDALQQKSKSFEVAEEEIRRRFFLKSCTCSSAGQPALLLSQPSLICGCGRSVDEGNLRIHVETSAYESYLRSCANLVNTFPIFQSDTLLRPIYRSLFLAVHWEVLDQIRAKAGKGENQAEVTLTVATMSSIFCTCCYPDEKSQSPEQLVQEFLDPSIAVLVGTGWPSSKLVNGILHGANFCAPLNHRQRTVRAMSVLQHRAVTRFETVAAAAKAFGDREVVQVAWEFVFLLVAEAKFLNSGDGIDCARLKKIVNFICRLSATGQNCQERKDAVPPAPIQEAGTVPDDPLPVGVVVPGAPTIFHQLQTLFNSAILECGETCGISFEGESCDKEYVSEYPKLDFDCDKVEALSHVFLILNSPWTSEVTALAFAMVQHSIFGTMLSLLNWVQQYVMSTAPLGEPSTFESGSDVRRNQGGEGEEGTEGPQTNVDSTVLFTFLQRHLQKEGHTVYLEKIGPLFKRLCSCKSAAYKNMIDCGVNMWQSVIGEASIW
jgi:hypothetical protein